MAPRYSVDAAGGPLPGTKEVAFGEALSTSDSIEDCPTDSELSTLRRVADHIPTGGYLVAFIELTERFAYYGLSVSNSILHTTTEKQCC
jgi:hypothetical protein